VPHDKPGLPARAGPSAGAGTGKDKGGRRLAGLAIAVLLAGCGGGGAPSLSLTMPPAFATSDAQTTLSGGVSLPAESVRSGGIPSMTIVTCQVGSHTMVWSNAANGSSGRVFVLWDCPKDSASWSAPGIPLSLGPNAVTVTITDANSSASGTVTVTRQ